MWPFSDYKIKCCLFVSKRVRITEREREREPLWGPTSMKFTLVALTSKLIMFLTFCKNMYKIDINELICHLKSVSHVREGDGSQW